MSDKLNINEQVQMILDIANQLRGPFKEDEDEAERNRIKRTVLPKLDWLIEQGVVNPGDKIHVISHSEEIATIVDGKHVNYKGELMSLNAFGCKVTGWQAIQSYAFIKRVNGTETLSQLREEKMKEIGMIE